MILGFLMHLPRQDGSGELDSPIVEAAINDFINKILKDFVVDLWYSEITPDKEVPELMRTIIMDAIGEISGRVKEINLVDLLTRDIVDLIGEHLDLFRRNQAAIGVDVMGMLSSEERDERLKHHLMVSKELHPALISPESEYKVLQRIITGVLAVVLRQREAQCPIVRTIARELVTCLVMQPIMDLASPACINELIEIILLSIRDDSTKEVGSHQSPGEYIREIFHQKKILLWNNQGTDMTLVKFDDQRETFLDNNRYQEAMPLRSCDWAQVLKAVTQKRDEVLTPENLENMWTKGRNYKRKEQKSVKAGVEKHVAKGSGINSAVATGIMGKEMSSSRTEPCAGADDKAVLQLTAGLGPNTQLSDGNENMKHLHQIFDKQSSFDEGHVVAVLEDINNLGADGNKNRLKRSSSTSALKVLPEAKKVFTGDSGGPVIAEFYSQDFGRRREEYRGTSASDIKVQSERQLVAKLKCRVIGAYFEKLGSKSFAVYSIAVTDSENRTWFVKRRYRNFERLHRHLKEIPNYTLHLPPKRIFSSSTEDAFVHQRCIQLDKYLQDLLSIANVAEQHEVWDFLSVASKNYSFGKSSSVMRTLAVNVDDAVDDIVRQFRGVSDGLMKKVVGSSPNCDEASSSASSRNFSFKADEISTHVTRQSTSETVNSFSDQEDGDKDESYGHQKVTSGAQASGWHSDNELNSKGFPPRGGLPAAKFSATPDHLEIGMPPEWTPSKVSVPLLNLVDTVFQLKRRGWLRWLVMEDAIDDWLLRQIYWLRREDIIAQGIWWIQDALWPGGTFFTRVGNIQSKLDDAQADLNFFQGGNQSGGHRASKSVSFEEQLEAARRASDVKKMLLEGAPTTLVSLIGPKQYKRCAKDIYYFTQSSVCVKQLAYGILELIILSVFPELRDLILNLHEKMRVPPA
ncbi:hypothetical protein Pint_34490 [Pistacia integerrima]|uniref:Uncharacterized protein n=1 Tax=Pistacia integerrima TaxID=434235 RepID=A0ACC0X4W6_9ROSI|nr:hypothetical protein Pint_34490 [Pistacia integerrima]